MENIENRGVDGMRTEEDFAKAYKECIWLVKFHNKPFWIVPTDSGYSISHFDIKCGLPKGTKTLKVTPEDF